MRASKQNPQAMPGGTNTFPIEVLTGVTISPRTTHPVHRQFSKTGLKKFCSGKPAPNTIIFKGSESVCQFA